MADKQWLSPKEIAAILEIAVSSIYREIERGRLPVHKFGGQYRCSIANFRNYCRISQISDVVIDYEST